MTRLLYVQSAASHYRRRWLGQFTVSFRPIRKEKVSSVYNNLTTSILTFIWHNLVPRVLFYPCFYRSAGMGRRGPGNEVTFNIQLFKTYLNDHDSNQERSWSNRAEKNVRRACKVYSKIPIKYRTTAICMLISHSGKFSPMLSQRSET